MAGIDKTYVKSLKEWREIEDWAKDKVIVSDYADEYVFLIEYIPEYTDEEIEKWIQQAGEVPIWNTGTFVDVWLMKNCPLEIIQNRLKEQYGEEYIKEVLEGRSEFDLYKRNGLGKKFHYTVLKKPTFRKHYNFWTKAGNGKWLHFKNSKAFWMVSVTTNDDLYWWYDELHDRWYNDKELIYSAHSSSAYHFKGNMGIKTLERLAKKWNLPAGAKITAESMKFTDEDYEIRIRK
jgi:hypothetical protein